MNKEDNIIKDAIRKGFEKGTYYGYQGWVCKKCGKTDKEITFWFTKDLCLDCTTKEDRYNYWVNKESEKHRTKI